MYIWNLGVKGLTGTRVLATRPYRSTPRDVVLSKVSSVFRCPRRPAVEIWQSLCPHPRELIQFSRGLVSLCLVPFPSRLFRHLSPGRPHREGGRLWPGNHQVEVEWEPQMRAADRLNTLDGKAFPTIPCARLRNFCARLSHTTWSDVSPASCFYWSLLSQIWFSLVLVQVRRFVWLIWISFSFRLV